jgi:hypothetical protein
VPATAGADARNTDGDDTMTNPHAISTQAAPGTAVTTAPISLVTWRQVLESARAAGYTHYRMRCRDRADDAWFAEHPGDIAVNLPLCDGDDDGNSGGTSYVVDFPFVTSLMPDGDFAGVALNTTEFFRVRNAWDLVLADDDAFGA